MSVDGVKVDEKRTSCGEPIGIQPECFDLSGSWTFEGQKYGAGTHAITVTASDRLGNQTSSTIYVTVNSGAYQPLGPGAVNLKTGDYRLAATDVSIGCGEREPDVEPLL